jgi:hypothetical protein
MRSIGNRHVRCALALLLAANLAGLAGGAEPGDAAPAAPPAPGKRVPRGLAGVGLSGEQVNRAIDRGRDFLWPHVKDEMAKGRYKLGTRREHILVILALLHTDARQKFPDFEPAVRECLAAVDPFRAQTYEAGIASMAIDALGDPDLLPLLGKQTISMVESQGPKGSWGYALATPKELQADPQAGRPLVVSGGLPLDGSPPGGAVLERRTPWEKTYDGDNSTSQYAILGLRAAVRLGLPISAETWKRALASYTDRHQKDGGWGYNNDRSYGSMTCAGIASTVLARSALGEKEPGEDPRVLQGLDWLAKNFSVATNPKHGRWLYYYLYSLERVGRILETEFIGDHEWYPLGARVLVDFQQPDGSWIGDAEEKDPRLATSFALLFLTRATEPLKTVIKRGGPGTLRTGVRVREATRFYIILDGSGSMLEPMEGRTKFEIARDAVSSIIGEMAEGSEIALRVYGHRKPSFEKGADEDTALEIPMGKLRKEEFLKKLRSLRARGKTPLARSLKDARQDLAGTNERKRATVVLLTDGGEDTTGPLDPVKTAEDLGRMQGVTFRIVGFDIGREDWKRQLLRMAEKAGGRYLAASNASALRPELRCAVFGLPEDFQVIDADGKTVARGVFGESKTLPEGKYRLTTSIGTHAIEEEFWINTDGVTSVICDAEAIGTLGEPEEGPAAPGTAKTAEAPPKDAPPPPPAGAGSGAPEGKKAAPRFCSECGKPLAPPYRFCGSCGAKVGS